VHFHALDYPERVRASPSPSAFPGRELNDRYFAGRPDGLRMSTGEDFLIAAA